jgi:type IV secretion system protein VirB9
MRPTEIIMFFALSVSTLNIARASDELPPDADNPSAVKEALRVGAAEELSRSEKGSMGQQQDLKSMVSLLKRDNSELPSPEVAQALANAQDEFRAELERRAALHTESSDTGGIPQPQKLSSAPNQSNDTLLEDLADQVDALKSKLVIERASMQALQTPKKVKVTGSKTVFNFKDTAVYEVTTSVDHVTDIQLKAGESLTTPPTAGDTVRWSVGVMQSGSSPNEITHLIIKPLDEGIRTNLIIATDQRVYQLKLKSGTYHMPVVSWNYPEDNIAKLKDISKRESSQEITISPDDLRFNYEIDGDESYPWTPIRVFDDGKKTFIQMPKELRVYEAPTLFILDEDSEPMLVNYRVKGDYYIVDRLFDQAELRVGPHKKIDIQLKRPNWFERNFF